MTKTTISKNDVKQVYKVEKGEIDGVKGWVVIGGDEPTGPYDTKKEAEEAKVGLEKFDEQFGQMIDKTEKRKKPTSKKYQPPIKPAEEVKKKTSLRPDVTAFLKSLSGGRRTGPELRKVLKAKTINYLIQPALEGKLVTRQKKDRSYSYELAAAGKKILDENGKTKPVKAQNRASRAVAKAK